MQSIFIVRIRSAGGKLPWQSCYLFNQHRIHIPTYLLPQRLRFEHKVLQPKRIDFHFCHLKGNLFYLEENYKIYCHRSGPGRTLFKNNLNAPPNTTIHKGHVYLYAYRAVCASLFLLSSTYSWLSRMAKQTNLTMITQDNRINNPQEPRKLRKPKVTGVWVNYLE